MADKTEFLQAIDDAILDADSLEKFINGSDSETVLTRLSAQYPTLQKALKELFENGGLPATPFKTKALMTASALVNGDYAVVTNDTDNNNNGLYIKESNNWVKTKYDPYGLITELQSKQNAINLEQKLVGGGYLSSVDDITTLYGSTTATSDYIVSRAASEGVEIKGTVQLQSQGIRKEDVVAATAKVRFDKPVSDVAFGTSSAYSYTSANQWYSNLPVNEWVIINFIFRAKLDNPPLHVLHKYGNTDDNIGAQMDVEFLSAVSLTDALDDDFNSANTITEFAKNNIFVDKPAPFSFTARDFLYRKSEYEHLLNNALINDGSGYESVSLWHKGMVTNSTYTTKAGVIGPHASFLSTGFIDVSGYEYIKLSGFTDDVMGYSFHDENLRLIKLQPSRPRDATERPEGYVLNGLIELPSGAKYFYRTLKTNSGEDISKVSIEGVNTKSKVVSFEAKDISIKLSKNDHANPIYETIFDSRDGVSDGVFDGDGIAISGLDNKNTGFINVSEYFGVVLSNQVLDLYWLDSDHNVTLSSATASNLTAKGFLAKPSKAQYLVVNIVAGRQLSVQGVRHINSNDLSKINQSADDGWQNDRRVISTSKTLEIQSPNDDGKPMRFYNIGKAAHNNDALVFDLEHVRIAHAYGISLNLHRPNVVTNPSDFQPVKNKENHSALLAEWGSEGFSWHVCPPDMSWDRHAWMTMKIGGKSVRSNTTHPFRMGTQIQKFVPEWTERFDFNYNGTEAWGWTPSHIKQDYNKTIPTNTLVRESNEFVSPDYYRISHGNSEQSTWDNIVRTRGTIKDPQAVNSGDIIYQQLFSVGTGKEKQGLPTTKDVAMIEVRYKEDSSEYEAEFVFKIKNKNTGEWDEVAKH